jgi:hypothetical protein
MPADLTMPAAAPAPPAPSLRRPAMLVAASALAGALVVAAFGAVWLLGRTSASGRPDAGSTVARQAAGQTSPPTDSRPEAEQTSPVAAAGDGSPAAEHWTTRSESGFSVPVPATWSRRSSGDNVFYEDPSTRLLLQIGTTPWAADPENQAQSMNASVSQSFRGYSEATVTPTTYLGVPAADLRFAYVRSTDTERVIDRFFRVGDQCFAIYFRMPADQWANSPRYLDPIFNGFHVG